MDKIIDEIKATQSQEAPQENKAKKKRCFVIMPISDADNYSPGHFGRVYDHLIKPACEQAGFEPIRADKNTKSDFIVIDIINQIVNCDMAICDLSSRNPNVFYELGLRQAFDLKTVLIKDEITARAFDISGIRTMEYKSTLRVDEVKSSIEELSKTITSTYNQKEKDGNSLIQLLAVTGPAKIPEDIKLGADTNVILNELRSLRSDMIGIQEQTRNIIINPRNVVLLPNGERVKRGTTLYKKGDDPFNDSFGEIVSDTGLGIIVRDTKGHLSEIPKDSDLWQNLTTEALNL